MGEVLRAVMDANAVYKAPVFYTIPIPPDTVAAFHDMNTQLQCKSDMFFMMTGVGVAAFRTDVPSGSYANANSFNQERLSFYRLNSTGQFINTPAVSSYCLLGQNFNAMMTFPEYILWKPSEIIGVNFIGRGLDTLGFQLNYFVTLFGIEYGMRK